MPHTSPSLYHQGHVAKKKKQLATSQAFIKTVIAREHFRVAQIIEKAKIGSRYYLAKGSFKGKPALLKICLFSHNVDRFTFEKFSREVIFLRFAQHWGPKPLRAAIPQLYTSGLTPRPWYIRENVTGQFQNIAGGIIRFKKSFFTPKNLATIVTLFISLQSITKDKLPLNFKHLLFPPDTIPRLWNYMRPHREQIEYYLRRPGSSQLIKKKLESFTRVHRRAPHVLAHQEPYAAHFIKSKHGFCFIDWENIGWATPVHDLVTLWLRASTAPAWQKKLYQRCKQHYRRYRDFDALWTAETLIQSTFNVISYKFCLNKKDFTALALFSASNIEKILANNFKP